MKLAFTKRIRHGTYNTQTYTTQCTQMKFGPLKRKKTTTREVRSFENAKHTFVYMIYTKKHFYLAQAVHEGSRPTLLGKQCPQ